MRGCSQRYMVKSDRLTGTSCPPDEAFRQPAPRVVLPPCTGNNLGDAAIQDALIANLRIRLPNIRFGMSTHQAAGTKPAPALRVSIISPGFNEVGRL